MTAACCKPDIRGNGEGPVFPRRSGSMRVGLEWLVKAVGGVSLSIMPLAGQGVAGLCNNIQVAGNVVDMVCNTRLYVCETRSSAHCYSVCEPNAV
jgi:hypothetical protein